MKSYLLSFPERQEKSQELYNGKKVRMHFCIKTTGRVFGENMGLRVQERRIAMIRGSSVSEVAQTQTPARLWFEEGFQVRAEEVREETAYTEGRHI